jgi:hypothetical protein
MSITITSPKDKNYNCIAWAAEDNENFWWPIGGHWPEGMPRILNLQCFIFAYGSKGYVVTDKSDLEVGYSKIAIYVDQEGIPQHASRQLSDGWWTSKLGPSYDIRHPFYNVWPDLNIDGSLRKFSSLYGHLGVLMKKKI